MNRRLRKEAAFLRWRLHTFLRTASANKNHADMGHSTQSLKDSAPTMLHHAGQSEHRDSGGSEHLLSSFGHMTLILQVGIVAALATLAFSNTLDGSFVYDDAAAVLENDDVAGTLTRSLRDTIVLAFSHDFWGGPLPGLRNASALSDGDVAWTHQSYRPITILTMRASWLWSAATTGAKARPFHIFNVASHVAASVLFLLLLRQLQVHVFLMAQEQRRNRWITAFAGAVLFAVHSVHSEAVANITGRAETLCACFSLSALLFYVKSLSSNHDGTAAIMITGKQAVFELALAQILAGLAVLSKETGSTVFGVMIMVDIMHEVSVATVVTTRGATSSLPAQLRLRWKLVRILSTLVIFFTYIFILRAWMLGLDFDIDMHASFNRYFTKSGSRAKDELAPQIMSLGHLHARSFQLLLCVDDHSYSSSYDGGAQNDSFGARFFAAVGQLTLRASVAAIPLLCSDNEFNNQTRLQFNHNFLEPVESLSDPRNVISGIVYTLLLVAVVVPAQTVLRQFLRIQSAKASGKASEITFSPTTRRSISTTLSALHMLFGLTWAVMAYLPSSHVLFPAGFLVAERVLYLPSMGYCIVAVELFWLAQRRCASVPMLSASRGKRTVCGILILLILFVLPTAAHLIACLRRNEDWQNSTTLYTSAIESDPAENCLALHGLAHSEYHQINSHPSSGARAEALFRRALKCDPTWGDSAGFLGKLVYQQSGGADAAEALRWFIVAGDTTPFKQYASNAGVLLFVQAQQLRATLSGHEVNGAAGSPVSTVELETQLQDTLKEALRHLITSYKRHNMRQADTRLGYVLNNAACAYTHPEFVGLQLRSAQSQSGPARSQTTLEDDTAVARARREVKLRKEGIRLLRLADKHVEAATTRLVQRPEELAYAVPLASGIANGLSMAYDALLRSDLRAALDDDPSRIAAEAIAQLERAVAIEQGRADMASLKTDLAGMQQLQGSKTWSSLRLTSCQVFLL